MILLLSVHNYRNNLLPSKDDALDTIKQYCSITNATDTLIPHEFYIIFLPYFSNYVFVEMLYDHFLPNFYEAQVFL